MKVLSVIVKNSLIDHTEIHSKNSTGTTDFELSQHANGMLYSILKQKIHKFLFFAVMVLLKKLKCKALHSELFH